MLAVHCSFQVLKLLIMAWDRRLIFTIGTSSTTGETDTVVWNEVHHKTEFGSNLTGHGYPDTNYLDNVMKELAAQGVGEDNLKNWGSVHTHTHLMRSSWPPERPLTSLGTSVLTDPEWETRRCGWWSDQINTNYSNLFLIHCHSSLSLSISRDALFQSYPECIWAPTGACDSCIYTHISGWLIWVFQWRCLYRYNMSYLGLSQNLLI